MSTFRKSPPKKRLKLLPLVSSPSSKKPSLNIIKINYEISKFLVDGKQYLYNKYGISSIDTKNDEFIVQYHKDTLTYSLDREFIDTYAIINIANDNDNEMAKRIAYTSVLELRKKYLS